MPTLHRLWEEEVVGHRLNLAVDLGVGDDLRQILQDQRPSRKVGMLIVDVSNVNSSVATQIDYKGSGAVQLSALQQLVGIIDLGPRSLPGSPCLHVSSESLEIRGTLLQPSEEVEVVRIGVAIVIHIDVGGFLVLGLGQVGGQVVASGDVLLIARNQIQSIRNTKEHRA